MLSKSVSAVSVSSADRGEDLNFSVELPQVLHEDSGFVYAVAAQLSRNILDLPDEVLAIIFSFSDATELVRYLSRVCSRFRNVILNDVGVWRDTYFTYDINNFSKSLLCHVIAQSPTIQCVRLRHPGSLTDMAVLHMFKDITSKHSKLLTLELECHEPTKGYSSNLINGLYDGCGETLRHLRMQGPLQQSAIASLFQFSIIATLELNDAANLTGSDLRKLCDQCPTLNWLSVPRASYIRDDDLSYFIDKKHSMLLGLDLSGYMLSDESIVHLSNAPLLIHLSIQDARFLEWGTLSALRTMKELRFIRLRRLRVTGLAISSWLTGSRNLHKLRFLDLQYGYSIALSDQIPLMIAYFCPNLQYLYLGGLCPLSKRACEIIKENIRNLLVFSSLTFHPNVMIR